MPVIPSVHRPPPDWFIASGFEERHLGTLKSGKEAEVFLIERSAGDRSCLLAHKRYRPRHPRPGDLLELGFSKGTIYRNDQVYRAGWHLKARERKAVEGGSRFGQELKATLWLGSELATLRRAWDAGVSVPFPVDVVDDGVLMGFIGDRTGAAPRVVDARLDAAGLREAWRQLVDGLRLLCRASIVHADLSVYNLLWWHDRLVVIDLPQAVDPRTNPEAPELLRRDVANVAEWFGRRGVPVDPDALFVDLLGDLFTGP